MSDDTQRFLSGYLNSKFGSKDGNRLSNEHRDHRVRKSRYNVIEYVCIFFARPDANYHSETFTMTIPFFFFRLGYCHLKKRIDLEEHDVDK